MNISTITGVNDLNCPKCGTAMTYDKKNDFHTCPNCFGEFWPGEDQTEQEKRKNQQIKYDKDSPYYFGLAEQTTAINSKPALPKGVPVIKGNPKSGRKHKKKPKKYTSNSIYW